MLSKSTSTNRLAAPKFKLAPWQQIAVFSPFAHTALLGGVGCVLGSTLVETENGKIQFKDLQAGMKVWSIDDDGPVLSVCGTPYKKGRARLFRVIHEEGEFVAHESHLLLCADGKYRHLAELSVGSELISIASNRLQKNSDLFSRFLSSARSYLERFSNLKFCYRGSFHSYGRQPRRDKEVSLATTQPNIDELKYSQSLGNESVGGNVKEGSHCYLSRNRLSKRDFYSQASVQAADGEDFLEERLFERTSNEILSGLRFQRKSECRPLRLLSQTCRERAFYPSFSASLRLSRILQISRLEKEEDFWDIEVLGTNNYIAEGAIHHNCGKSFSLAHFVIRMVEEHPELTGFIGANSYDQLSHATLRELFYWLEYYGYDYRVDSMPPVEWGLNPKKFKKWSNILTVWNPRTASATCCFTRVLSEPDALRGIEFSWYAIDETRDTPNYTHDVLLARMRESDFVKGLIGSTTNGEDWVYERFVKGNDGTGLYGSLHVPTEEAVKCGILTEQYYNTLLRSYSPLMAQQELFAQHVNVSGGRAYYAGSQKNEARISPWGEDRPNEERPLVVGCDFNYSPAPLVWMIGQVGPNTWGEDGVPHWERIHWYGELSGAELSTRQAAMKLVERWGDRFYYRIFGDASGNKGTTSNAGVHDYQQIAQELVNLNVACSVDWVHGEPDEAKGNPRVKNRVEHMNAYLMNALGEVRMTYNPDTCPHFHADLRTVGWKKMTGQTGLGKLDDGGDYRRTHASDAAGYALMKVHPPKKVGRIVEPVTSPFLRDING